MKKSIMFLVIAVSIFTIPASAQKMKPSPEPYWVVENNLKTPKNSVVCFYNTDHALMYKENIQNKKINVNREKTRRMLDAMLTEVATAWNQKKQLNGEEAWEGLVAKKLKSKNF